MNYGTYTEYKIKKWVFENNRFKKSEKYKNKKNQSI